MYIYICIYIQTYVYLYLYLSVPISTYIYIYIYQYLCLSISISIPIDKYIHLYIYIYFYILHMRSNILVPQVILIPSVWRHCASIDPTYFTRRLPENFFVVEIRSPSGRGSFHGQKLVFVQRPMRWPKDDKSRYLGTSWKPTVGPYEAIVGMEKGGPPG